MKICESSKQKLLAVVIDRNLNFDIFLIYAKKKKKTGRKLYALARFSNPEF